MGAVSRYQAQQTVRIPQCWPLYFWQALLVSSNLPMVSSAPNVWMKCMGSDGSSNKEPYPFTTIWWPTTALHWMVIMDMINSGAKINCQNIMSVCYSPWLNTTSWTGLFIFARLLGSVMPSHQATCL